MSGVTFSMLVEAALMGQARNHQRLGDSAKRYSRKITNRFCADFPEDLHDEVFQQAFVELFALGAAALVGTTGQALFRRTVFAAIRVVRSDYAAPGQRTRRPGRGAAPDPSRIAAEDVGRIADAEAIERATLGEGDDAAVEFDLIESAAAAIAFRACEDRIELEWALRSATPKVADALRLICVRGETLSFAAAGAGLSRFALGRRLDSFCPDWRLAA